MINVDQLEFVGRDLRRPECVLCTSDGTVHVADWRGGVTLISPDGSQSTVLAQGDFKPKPNGIAILPEGGWLLAHLGDDDGGVFRLEPNGSISPLLLEIDGIRLPPTNYVHVDGQGRIWVTVSTRQNPRSLGYHPDCADGFVALLDKSGARIVADGLGFTNECLIHPISGQLYLNETFGRRLTRFDVGEDGTLSNKTVVAEFGPGTFPDGLTFDVAGGIWISSIVSNRLIHIDASGRQRVMLQDAAQDDIETVERAFLAGEMGRPHLDKSFGRALENISSAAFGGPDLRTVYLGCLLGDRIATFRSTIPGLAPSHWNWNLSHTHHTQAAAE